MRYRREDEILSMPSGSHVKCLTQPNKSFRYLQLHLLCFLSSRTEAIQHSRLQLISSSSTFVLVSLHPFRVPLSISTLTYRYDEVYSRSTGCGRGRSGQTDRSSSRCYCFDLPHSISSTRMLWFLLRYIWYCCHERQQIGSKEETGVHHL